MLNPSGKMKDTNNREGDKMQSKSSSKIGIGTLLTIGFAIAIVLAVIIGGFSVFNLKKMSTSFKVMSENSIEVSSELNKLKNASMSGASEASKLTGDMNNRLVKKLRTNAADMQDLQQTFISLSSTLQNIIDSGEEDATLLLLELEDIHELVQREWIPQVRGIAEEITKTSDEGTSMALTVDKLGVNLANFVGLAENGSNLSEGIMANASENASKADKSIIIMLTVLILSICGVFVMAIITKRGIINPIKKVTYMIRDIAEGEGDLTKRLEITVNDELGELSHWFNAFVDKLEKIISGLGDNSRSLAASSTQLLAASSQITTGTTDQDLRASQVATATQQLNATVIEVAKNASGAAEAARIANDKASDGGKVVTRTIDSIKGISITAKESSEAIRSLGERSQDIGKIIRVIDEIADQTNLLALNAAIEAARAGEQGRGFAVVAEEVRKLAERTSTATKEIGEMITSIQEETGKAIETTDREIMAVEEGVSLAEEAGNSLSEIVTQVEMVNNVIAQIATASEEQSVAADQISDDIETVSKITSETSTNAKQIASLGSEIDNLASALRATVEKFKVSAAASITEKESFNEINNVEVMEVLSEGRKDEDESQVSHLSLLSK